MKKLLLFLLIPFLSFGQVQIGENIDGESAGDESGTSTSISGDGSIIAIGSPRNDDNGFESGHVRIFENQGGTWSQVGDIIKGESANDQSGYSVSLSVDGSIIAIGARFNNNVNGVNAGHVRIYENEEGEWFQIGDDINGEMSTSAAGESVSLSADGNIVAIAETQFSDPSLGNFIGQVKVYENIGEVWTQIGNAIIGENNSDGFSSVVNLSSNGDILAIGLRANDVNGDESGKVKIYENISGEWIQLGNDINGTQSNESFGTSIDSSEDGFIIAVGAIEFDINSQELGLVRVFQFTGDSWVQIGEDINGESLGDLFGRSVSLSSDGSTLVVGATQPQTGLGYGKIFRNQSDQWIHVGENINGDIFGANFGKSVSISNNGETVIIGASGNFAAGEDAGYVGIYDLSDLLSTQQPTQTKFSLYPNPTKNNFTITVVDQDTLQKVTIYNSLGQEVLNSTQETIDVSSLSKGVYVVEVQTTTGKGSEKLIIN